MSSLMASLTVFVYFAMLGFASSKHLRSDYLTTAVAPPSPHLLEELETIMGREHRLDVEARAKRLEEVMRPTYLSMPKDASGHLGEEAVRYLMHRIFVDRHGWYVRGLHNSGDSWNSSSPLEAIKDHVSEEIPEIFDKHSGESGMSLHHTAVLAATLERLVHEETVGRLQSAYRTRRKAVDESHDGSDITEIVDAYMLLYLAGIENHTNATPLTISRLERTFPDAYAGWDDTKTWSHGILETTISQKGNTEKVAFADAVQAVETIADKYGKYQNQECLDLKASLMQMERNGTGRVPVEVFYQSALDGQWQFSEALPYLRQLGALDESKQGAPAVIIPNYLNGPSNCVASSKFYAVCCIDECEPLLGHIEQSVAAPDASPEFIAELVSNLPSATVSAPRELPKELLQRLQEIADHHGGTVPLHGRLFAQWLHHAYPRECSYPHLSGTTQPMSSSQWTKETGDRSTCSPEEMATHIEEMQSSQTAAAAAAEQQGGELHWVHEEELFISRPASMPPQPMKRRGGGKSIFRTVSLLAAVVSMAVMLVRGLAMAKEVLMPDKYGKLII